MKMDENGRRKKQVNVDGNELLLGAGLIYLLFTW